MLCIHNVNTHIRAQYGLRAHGAVLGDDAEVVLTVNL